MINSFLILLETRIVYIDFRIEDDIIKYCDDNVDHKKIKNFIFSSKNVKIDENTLLIFDEI